MPSSWLQPPAFLVQIIHQQAASQVPRLDVKHLSLAIFRQEVREADALLLPGEEKNADVDAASGQRPEPAQGDGEGLGVGRELEEEIAILAMGGGLPVGDQEKLPAGNPFCRERIPWARSSASSMLV